MCTENKGCRVMAIANQKGGTAKTTTASNLGIGLAKRGKRVLLIDADPQGSLSASLGIAEPDELKISLATVLADIIEENEIEMDKGILHNQEGVDLMPGNIELSGLEVSLVNVMRREFIMKSYVDMQRNKYDYIIIDSMPSLGLISLNVLASADSVLIPVQAAYLPMKGLQQLIKTIGKVKRQLNKELQMEGIVLTMVDRRTNFAKEIIRKVKEVYGKHIRIYETCIPKSVRVEETSAEGLSIYAYDPKGAAAAAYNALTEEVLSNE